MIAKKIRVIDTKSLTAAENMAIDEILLELREDNKIPDTIRFLSFNPHCVLVGYFQSIEDEVRTSFCKKNEIDINRRITGGGALYWGMKDVGWEIFAQKDSFSKYVNKFEDYYKLFCSAVANGLKYFNIDANFRPRNDIEVNGKKISGSGGTSISNAFMFQGTLLVDIDINMMLRSLRVPVEKLKYKEINSLKERITWLSRELGYCPDRQNIINNILYGFKEFFDFEFYFDELSNLEKKILKDKLGYFKSKEHIYRIKKANNLLNVKSTSINPLGLINCNAEIDFKRNILKRVIFTGDFFIYPKKAIFDLESILKNISLNKDCLKAIIKDFYKNYSQKIEGVSWENIFKAFKGCLDKLEVLKAKFPKKYIKDIFLINEPFMKANYNNGLNIYNNINNNITNNILNPLGCTINCCEINYNDKKDNKNKINNKINGNNKIVNSFISQISKLKKLEVFLLPYCAKLPQCKFRYKQGCSFCGKCSVGDAIKILNKKSIKNITITSYEHLEQTLINLKNTGVKFFGGACCEAFYLKHLKDFERIGLDGILINIDNKTCYDLGKYEDAYVGKFEGFTKIKIQLLEKIINLQN